MPEKGYREGMGSDGMYCGWRLDTALMSRMGLLRFCSDDATTGTNRQALFVALRFLGTLRYKRISDA